MSSDALELFATWALAHELADQEYRAAVQRGSEATGESTPASLSDRLMALIDDEKERLKTRLANPVEPADLQETTEDALAEVRFELAALRSRLDTIEVSIDAILLKLG